MRLGTGATACIHLLPPVLRGLRRGFPRLEIVVSTGNTPLILKAIEESAVDVGLVTLPTPGRMFEVTPLIEDEIVAVFPGDAPDVVTAAVLGELPVLLDEPGGTSRRIIDA